MWNWAMCLDIWARSSQCWVRVFIIQSAAVNSLEGTTTTEGGKTVTEKDRLAELKQLAGKQKN